MITRRLIVALPALMLVAAAWAPALARDAGGSAAKTEEVEEVEDVEDVEEVQEVQNVQVRGSGAGAAPPLGTRKLLGRIHPLAVHMPIAWLLLLLIVDGATLLLRRPWHRAGRLLLSACVLSVIPAVVTGVLLAGGSASTGEDLQRLLLHRNLAFGVAGVCVAALVVRLARPEPLAGTRRIVYAILVLAAVGLVSAVGHLGGAMVFGADYLPF